MSNKHGQNCSSPDASHVFSSTYFLLEAILLVSMNVSFVYVLYKCRTKLNWKTSTFVLNLSISDVFAGVALFALAISRYFYICTINWVIENGVQLALSYSILITVLSYNSLYFVQFLAVRYPIYYQTKCTRSYFIKILVLQYLSVLGFEIWKGFMLNTDNEVWFSFVEIAVMSTSFVINICLYTVVLIVAGKRQGPSSKKSMEERKLSTFISSNDDKIARMKEYLKYMWLTMTKDYWGITTAGLHLLIYVVTFLPLVIIDITVVASVDDNGLHGDIYKCESTPCHMGLVIWFARGIADPLLHFIRNPKLHYFKHKYTGSDMSRTGTTNVEEKRKSTVATISETVKNIILA